MALKGLFFLKNNRFYVVFGFFSQLTIAANFGQLLTVFRTLKGTERHWEISLSKMRLSKPKIPRRGIFRLVR
jgi:hypothetical protein